MPLSARLVDATRRLAEALDLPPREARLEAQVLFAHALGVNRAWLIGHDRDPLSPEQTAAVETLLKRRLAGEPVAYLLGEREFYCRPFRVTPDVLIPRPDTELLVEAALARLPKGERLEVLDIGVGSGAIAVSLALERPECRVTGVDLSEAALRVAQDNAANLRATVEFSISDGFAALAGRRFHLIVSNPPYIAATDPHLARGDLRFEPPQALASGADGLDLIRRLVAQAPAHLGPPGWLLFEHGWQQAATVRTLLATAGFTDIFSARDLAGHERVTGGRNPPRIGPVAASSPPGTPAQTTTRQSPRPAQRTRGSPGTRAKLMFSMEQPLIFTRWIPHRTESATWISSA